jgi:hypothetical protein
MKCAALTGISPAVIAELRLGKPRTLELQSAHNIITLTTVEPGDCLCLTAVDLDDLSPGDNGIIVDVISVIINMKRMIEFHSSLFYEERERMSIRMQVKFMDTTMIKQVEGKEWDKPTVVEVVKASCYHAG